MSDLYCGELLKFLKQQIENVVFAKEQAGLVYFEVANYPHLLNVCGRNHLEQILNLIQEVFERDFYKNNVFKVACDSFLVIILAQKREDFESIVESLHKKIEFLNVGNNSFPNIHIVDAIGVAEFSGGHEDVLEVFDQAYIACKLSRFDSFHSRYCLNYNNINCLTGYYDKLKSAAFFKQAILENRIVLAYQPVVNAKSGEIDYHECLMRIKNGDDSIISCGKYIEIAEELGFINLVDELIIDLVYKELLGNKDLKLSFNISGYGVDNDNVIFKLRKYFSNQDIAKRTIVEITETALQRDLKKSAFFISSIRDLGCMVALDDFGAGNSSFQQLLTFPLDIIKIDGSYVKEIFVNKYANLFVHMVVEMASKFNLKTVAEYVESGDIAKALIDMGVDCLQGNYLSPALNNKSWDV